MKDLFDSCILYLLGYLFWFSMTMANRVFNFADTENPIPKFGQVDQVNP